jgi:glycosyltransferase involved in cell wall biosynthesis
MVHAALSMSERRPPTVQPRRIRVLHVIWNLNYGGMERLLADIIRRADPARFESHLLVLHDLGRFAEGLEEVATLHVADGNPKWSMIWPGALAKQIRAIAPDVVHTHSGVWYKVSLAARMAGVRRIVHTDHGRASPDPLKARLIDRIAATRTDAVVAVSAVLAEQMARTIVRDRERLHVVTNGVDTTLYQPRHDDGVAREELGIDASTPILGSVGRLEPIKGYDVMLAAFARLRAEWRDGSAPVLVLVGDGSERTRLEEDAKRAGIADGIRFLGWRDDIVSMHRSFTLFTMSSRSEGTSVSLLEAMSAGLCPVVTNVGGNAATLGAELQRRLVPSEDPAALCAAWKAALADSAARENDAQRARARVIDAFSLDAMVNAYERLYDA